MYKYGVLYIGRECTGGRVNTGNENFIYQLLKLTNQKQPKVTCSTHH